jgi:hypothetical protein
MARPGNASAAGPDRSGPPLIYTRAQIVAFLAGVKDGEFDDLCGAAVPGRYRKRCEIVSRPSGNAVISCCARRVLPASRCGGAVVTDPH